jgi:hypothetical protein
MSNFFASMPGFRDFAALTDESHYVDAPEDWTVVVTDVEGSTQAIQEGRYKTVNMVGAATIAAVVNATGHWDLPFVFGGDGATALVPNDKLEPVRQALAQSRLVSLTEHGLRLRIGLVPHRDLLAAGCAVRVGKYLLADQNALAFFKGQGLSLAEEWVKAGKYRLPEWQEAPAFDPHRGLSCRWAPLRSSRGVFLSILIKIHSHNAGHDALINEILRELDVILDLNSPEANPVKAKVLKPERAGLAARMESSFLKGGSQPAKFLKTLFFIYFVWALDRGLIKLKSFDMKKYKASLAPNSDFRKFDETLRMVVDCTPAMQAGVERLLEGYHALGNLSYGLHVSDTALMTCFVQNYNGRHLHFIDGGDGGYAFASRGLKERIRRRETG